MKPKILKINFESLSSVKGIIGCLIIAFITSGASAVTQVELAFEGDVPQQQYNNSAKKNHFIRSKQLGLSKEEAMKMADTSPAFGVYRENYFVTGIPLNKKVTDITADAAFQISIKHRITRKILPFDTFAYLTYSQKSFWDIYAESSPFRDSNYNPGLGLGKFLFRDNKLIGAASVQAMHESNGRDSIDSRSWNYLSLSAKYYFSPNFCIAGEFWPPFTEFGTNSKDLIDYKGYGCLSVNYLTNNRRWWLSADLLPRKGFGNINTAFTAAFRVSSRSTQYLFARFYQGYGESQKDYRKYVINIRVGMCIKPDFFSIF
jgi:phospholipase A1